jgi:hypothetical protein
MGEDILGKFYCANRDVRTKREAQKRAFPFFKPYMHMVRPIALGTTAMDGTLTDGLVNLCASASGDPWGMVIFVRTAEVRYAVTIPCPDNFEGFATYHGFLNNDHELIHVMRGVFEGESFRFEKERRPLPWPKSGDLYPSSIQ